MLELPTKSDVISLIFEHGGDARVQFLVFGWLYAGRHPGVGEDTLLAV